METVTNKYKHFIDLCQEGNKTAIHSFLEKGVSVNDTDENGITLLHVASFTGAEIVLTSLLSKDAEVDRSTNIGWTPLMCAARSGQFKLVEQLVDNGADVSRRNKFGIGVLSAAAANGSKEVIKILLNVLHKSSLLQDDIACSLRIAALHGHSDTLQLLLDSDTHLINASDEHGITPLMLASAGGHEKAAKTLLDFGANGDIKNLQGFTALDIASAKGYKKLECLLKKQTEKTDDHHHDDFMHSNIGFDLVECYGWSSNCTPKLRGRTQDKNFPSNHCQNALNNNFSSYAENNPLSSKMLLEETENNSNFVSLLFSPVNQSLCYHSSLNTHKLDNLSMELKSSPTVPTFPLGRESVKQTIQKGSTEKIWIGGKVEKWLHSFLSLWKKKVKVNKSRHHHQREKMPNTNMRENLTTSSNPSTLNNLLINLDLMPYVSLFQQHEIDMDSFLMLSQEDLEDIGITSPRCKNKLLKVIKAFKGEI